MNSDLDDLVSVDYGKQKIRRAAGAVALEYHAQGKTPEGWTIAQNAESITEHAIAQAVDMAGTGAMTWLEAAGRVADTLKQITLDAQKGRA